jgi:hypothetical protein
METRRRAGPLVVAITNPTFETYMWGLISRKNIKLTINPALNIILI